MTPRRGCPRLRKRFVAKWIYASEPKAVNVSCITCCADDRFSDQSSRMPGTFGGRCRVICSKEHIPRDLQRGVEIFVSKSLSGGLKFGLPHWDLPRIGTSAELWPVMVNRA
jgi:hypothetical protein